MEMETLENWKRERERDHDNVSVDGGDLSQAVRDDLRHFRMR